MNTTPAFLKGCVALLFINLLREGASAENCGNNKVGVNEILLKENATRVLRPVSYENSSCIWQIIAPKNHIVVIGISQVSFRFNNDDCNKERFIIFDGNSTSDNQVAKYCTSNNPRTFVDLYLSNLNGRLELKQGDPASPRKVFYIFAKKKQDNCHDGKLEKLMASSSPSNFSSPNYPKPYPPGVSRQWLIEAPAGKYIKLEFNDVVYFFCKAMILEVYDGDSKDSRELIRNVCRKNDDNDMVLYPKIAVFSKGQKMFVLSKSLEYVQYPFRNKGFRASFSAIKEVKGCGARQGGVVINLNAHNGMIQSPNYPFPHPSNLTCSWHVTVTAGNVIEITATSAFRRECSKQWVNIYDGTNTSGHLLVKLCYIDFQSFFSSNNHIVVEFVTTGTVQSKGFSISYTARSTKPKPYACLKSKHRQITNATTGKIASQRFPLLYLNHVGCWFDIQVPLGNFVYLTFTTFDLGNDNGKECKNDYVQIRSVDGFGAWKKSSVLCGKKKTPITYISSTNRVTVYFESDARGQHLGFEATFQRISYLPLSSSCGASSLTQKLESSSGSISSYEYPLKYQNNVQCTWFISTTSSLYKFNVKFDYMDIEPSSGCTDDYVEVIDGSSSSSSSLGRFCGSKKPDSFKSSESSIFVEFKTNGTGRYGGFKLLYEQTYNWKGILLIVLCTLFFIALVCFIGFIVRKYCCKNRYKGIATETVNLNPTI